MKEFYLGLRGLEPADSRLVEVFLKFIADSGRRWSLADGRPADLVLSALSTGAAGADVDAPDDIAWILPPGGEAPGKARFLQRPLQIEAFKALLAAREAQMGNAASAARALDASGTVLPRASRDAVTAGTTAPFVNDPRHVYRLRKWPGGEMLRGKPKFVRMLGFLSHKPLSVQRLMVLSGIDEASCLELLGALDVRKLLSRHEATPDSSLPVFAVEPTAVALRPAGVETRVDAASLPANGGLFKRLRARLGLA